MCLFVPLFVSCVFVTSRKSKFRTKGNKSGSKRKETDNNPGAAVSVDQLQSAHPGLVPKLSGKLTIVRIWYAQVMVDHFSGLAYVNLIRSTSQ